MKVLVFVCLHLLSVNAYAVGFRSPSQATDSPLVNVDRSVFKVRIDGAKMYGTAFAVAPNILITNVHNITQCLAEHGLISTGYDGKRGSLRCSGQAIENGRNVLPFFLLGSNPRYSEDNHDFAAIEVPNLNAIPLELSHGPMAKGDESWVVGYPSETYRSNIKAEARRQSLLNMMKAIFESLEKVDSLDSQKHESKNIFENFMNDGFLKIQVFAASSEFLSGALLGSDWNLLSAWQNEDSFVYKKNLLSHLAQLKLKTYSLLKLAEVASRNPAQNNEDADETLKVSTGRIHHVSSQGIMNLKGDATPGSSGSAVLNKQGKVIGILFQLRTLDGNSEELCVLDAVMTSFESILYSYCPTLGPVAVSSVEIHQALRVWNIGH